jgi:hypothetical protein
MEDRLDTITRFYFEHYIAGLNIEYYKKLLETEIDEPKRRTVTRLLAEAIEPAPGGDDIRCPRFSSVARTRA